MTFQKSDRVRAARAESHKSGNFRVEEANVILETLLLDSITGVKGRVPRMAGAMKLLRCNRLKIP